jgi:predicted nucleic acid-binding protein
MKNREVFIDTGAYLSRCHIRDGKHDLSREIWQKLRDDNRILITSNHVLDELATILDGFVKSPNSVLRCILRFFKVR